MWECHEVPRLPREMKLRDAGKLQNDPPCRASYRHGHTALTWTVADGCERLRNVWRTQLNPHTPRVKREPLLRIWEKGLMNQAQVHGCRSKACGDFNFSNEIWDQSDEELVLIRKELIDSGLTPQ